uniref:uncharacterized protein LOC122604990 n=1 Tax=Erigeron canadensis TaxID=72917 RepID=UPI001CB95B4D|nr:uncharacterized protein LOC122604990 [Erigeron canadensis]
MHLLIQSFNQIYTSKCFNTYLEIWDKLRFSLKFHYVTKKNVRVTSGEWTTKRLKTSSSTEPQCQGSDACVNIDLNEFTEDEPVFQERPPREPRLGEPRMGGRRVRPTREKGWLGIQTHLIVSR